MWALDFRHFHVSESRFNQSFAKVSLATILTFSVFFVDFRVIQSEGHEVHHKVVPGSTSTCTYYITSTASATAIATIV